MTSLITNYSNNVARDLNYSRVLDVHVWSDYKEVNDFVSLIYDAYFSSQNGKKSIAKRHIKLVLLDLYVAWLIDPDLCIGVHMTRDFYSKSLGTNSPRYNELNISAKTTNVVDLPPEAPSFITRVCGFGFHILLRQFEQARRVRSPQISQALGALQRVFGCAEMSAV